MTLQQLKYADAIADCGSISEAARRVFVTQPTLTESVRLLEEELRIAIFNRSSRGVSVTREGEEFLASARQILDDAARIQEKYTGKAVRRPQFAVSCQHYAFAVEAFMEVVRACAAESYDFTIRETVTSEIIDDVARHRSEIGLIYLSRRNETPLRKILHREELEFEELFAAKPHVFLGKKHPLAKRKSVKPDELDGYPYLTYEQGTENALYFSEEIMPAIDRKKNIRFAWGLSVAPAFRFPPPARCSSKPCRRAWQTASIFSVIFFEGRIGIGISYAFLHVLPITR